LAEPSAVFVYGPFAFMAASCVLSLALTPWSTRLVQATRKRFRSGPRAKSVNIEATRDADEADEVREMFRSGPKPQLDRAMGLIVSIAFLWGGSSAVGGLLLLAGGEERPGALPGEHVDGAVLAHAVPPLSNLAARQIVARLEHAADVGRWDQDGALEPRLVLAARLDPSPEKGVERLLHHGYRTRAARFASAHPSAYNCEKGMLAAADALRGGLLFDLMMACRNVKGDSAAHAAFKMGDFSRSLGPESESIVSRVTRAPEAEPACLAGGYEMPPPEEPLCRLIHAEAHPALRQDILTTTAAPGAFFAQRWAQAAKAELGEPMAESLVFTIDPENLVLHPFDAVIEQPIAVYQDIRIGHAANLTPGQSAWVHLALAAERSAMSRHLDAALLVDEAFSALDIGDGASDEERGRAACLAAAIALRADDSQSFALHAEACPKSGPLYALARDLAEPDAAISSQSLDLDAAPFTESPIMFRRAVEAERAQLREWLRERFPSCERCAFFRELRRLAAIREAAGALGDEDLVQEVEPVVARFEAVFLNRSLALSLRAADPTSASADPESP